MKKKNFAKNLLGEVGRRVPSNFEYRSDNNTFLSIEKIKKFNKESQ